MENTEKLIVEQLKNGNEDAYKYIYDYHYVLLCHAQYSQPIITQYFTDNKSEIWSLSLIAHSKR